MKRSRTHRTTAAVLLARNGYRGIVAVDLEGLHAFRSTAHTAILTESPALCSRRTLHAISSASGWSRSLMRTTSVPEEKKSQHSSSPTGRMLLKLRRYASETPAPAGNADQDKEKEPPNEGRIKSFIKKYGPVGVVTYFGMYGLTLGSLYMAFESGLMGSGDVTWIVEHIPLHEWLNFDPTTVSTKVGSFATAWIVTKFTEPLRLGATMALTPWIRRFLVRRGIMSGPPRSKRSKKTTSTTTSATTPPSTPPSTK